MYDNIQGDPPHYFCYFPFSSLYIFYVFTFFNIHTFSISYDKVEYILLKCFDTYKSIFNE